MKKVVFAGAVTALMLGLTACDGKSSAVAPTEQGAWGGSGVNGGAPTASTDPRDAPVPQVNGKPMWAANRKHTAEENALYQFNKNGGDFAAKDENDYVARAHAFVDNPPAGVQTLDRSNGDKLIYDPHGNVFVVVTRNGAPRTMFKPRGGAGYWAQQKDREDKAAKGASGASDQG